MPNPGDLLHGLGVLYLKDDSRCRFALSLHYHEGWNAGECLIEHWRIVGQTGEVKERPLPMGSSEADMLAQMSHPA